MNPKERRKFPRFATNSPRLNITFTKGDTQSVSQIEGRVINVSLCGLQIETQYAVVSEDVHLRAIDLEDNQIEIKGRVVYCEKISPEIFHVGISFIGSNMDKYKFMGQLTIPFSNSQKDIAIGDERSYL